jgi:uncharacterized metal-binding protein YceD (DUF177 family)
MSLKSTSSLEFSRPVDIAELDDAETRHAIEAGPDERVALASRFGLEALDSLHADVRLRRVRGGSAIRLSGTLEACVTQSCVVTLKPVRRQIVEPFDIHYATESATEEVGFGADADIDWPEPLPAGPLDIGEAVAQQLSLALDPYPRADGAVVAEISVGTPERSENPFARLAVLRKITPNSGEA